MIYTQTLAVTFDLITEADEIKKFLSDNQDWEIIPSTGGVSFAKTKTIWATQNKQGNMRHKFRDKHKDECYGEQEGE